MLNMGDSLFLDPQTKRDMYVVGMWSPNCTFCPNFTTIGQSRSWAFMPTGSAPFKVTLVWHDFPSFTGSLINDLDLVVRHGDDRYYANGQDKTDTVNNVEQVIVPGPTVGVPINVKVVATNLTFFQPYAMVVTGAFKKTSALFPRNVPIIVTVTRVNTLSLRLAGSNLPLAQGSTRSVITTCSDDTTPITAVVTDFSGNGTSLDVAISTTDCPIFSMFVIASGFIGDPVTVDLDALAEAVSQKSSQ